MHGKLTYPESVAEYRAYGWYPMEYEVWLSWRVNKPIKDLTDEDRKAHPKEGPPKK